MSVGSCYESPSPGRAEAMALLAGRHGLTPRIQHRQMLGQHLPQTSKHRNSQKNLTTKGANPTALTHCTPVPVPMALLFPRQHLGGPSDEPSRLLCLLGWAVQE